MSINPPQAVKQLARSISCRIWRTPPWNLLIVLLMYLMGSAELLALFSFNKVGKQLQPPPRVLSRKM
jgi:hypothetical protein